MRVLKVTLAQKCLQVSTMIKHFNLFVYSNYLSEDNL